MTYDRKHCAVEIVPGLILGGIQDLYDMLARNPDVLVPLDHLPGIVWDKGFRGEILYYPITDYGVLPDDVLDELAEKVTALLGEKRRVAMFCAGGHGRTGYAAACVLHLLGQATPIAFLRKNYHMSAVESEAQAEAVFSFCRRHAGGQSSP